MQSALCFSCKGTATFAADGAFTCKVNLPHASADGLIAKGVSIDPAATFSLRTAGQGSLPIGTTFPVINNVSPNHFSGAFANLPDNGIITVGGVKVIATYKAAMGMISRCKSYRDLPRKWLQDFRAFC